MRKGQANKVLWWVFGVAVLIFVIFFVQLSGKVLYPSGQKAASCLATIQAMDKEQGSLLSYFVSGTNVPLMCETNWRENLTVKEKDAEKQTEELLNQITPLMRECWVQFGEGKLDPFENHILTNDFYCFVCSRFIVNFDEITELSGDETYVLEKEAFLNYTDKRYSGKFVKAFPLDEPFIERIDVSKIANVYTEQVFYTMDGLIDAGHENNDYAVVLMGYAPKKFAEATGIAEAEYKVFVSPYDHMSEIGCEELVKQRRID